jgi:uncharacterized protein YfdQ (DUF2303 family)
MSEVNDITTLVKGAALVPSILTDARGIQHAFVPGQNGSFTRQELTPAREILPKPAFIDQLVNIDQTNSLIDYVNRFKTADTVIFANLDDTQIVAVIDYHKAASEGPGLVEHRAVLELSHSAEWETWNAINGRMYDQKSFARMLDINSDDIANPTAATLLETVMDLEMSSSVTVQRKLASTGSSRGEGGVSRKIDGTVLPAFFTLSIPVFTGEPNLEVKAMTRDTIDGNTGKISLGLELVRTRILIETELARIGRAIATATSVPVMLGSIGE